MKREQEEGIHRRRVIEAGVAGAALLVLPEACGSSTGDGQGDASMDATTPKDGPTKMDSPMKMDTGGPCKTDFVDAGGSCAQSDQTAAINIVKAGLDQPGTSYEFSDCRYVDKACCDDRIILIHPTTKMGYVALSGACPHECCDRSGGSGGPTYMPICRLSVDNDILGGFDCNVGDAGTSDGGSDAGSEAGSEAGADGGADAATDAGTDAKADSGSGGPHAGQVLTDILYCTCHGSIFNALTGAVINTPAQTGLAKLDTCEADGWIFVTIPKAT
jgi:Rieske Fe-S protein